VGKSKFQQWLSSPGAHERAKEIAFGVVGMVILGAIFYWVTFTPAGWDFARWMNG
jgi:hypothetical protein